jgi:hypothetical protein
VIEIPLRAVEYSLGLRVLNCSSGKSGLPSKLIERHVALLNRVFRLQLRGHNRYLRGIEIGLRTRLRDHQLALAIDVVLLELDICRRGRPRC